MNGRERGGLEQVENPGRSAGVIRAVIDGRGTLSAEMRGSSGKRRRSARLFVGMLYRVPSMATTLLLCSSGLQGISHRLL